MVHIMAVLRDQVVQFFVLLSIMNSHFYVISFAGRPPMWHLKSPFSAEPRQTYSRLWQASLKLI